MTVDTPKALQQRLDYIFEDEALLLEALTHRSFVAEYDSAVPDNQRLEFLGDAVIQIIVTGRIYSTFPHLPEGRMTRRRAVVTRQPTLAALARGIDLGRYLRLGRGEEMNGGRERDSTLCDAFEALFGALYLDQQRQLPVPDRIFNRILDGIFPDLGELLEHDNPKGVLQEWSQQELGCKPVYETTAVSGPDHQREFTVEVRLADTAYGLGVAGKRQAAEALAARAAIEKARHDHPDAF